MAANSSEADMQMVTFLLDSEEYAINVMAVGVTEKNAAGAAESLNAAKGLEGEVDELTKMVNAFKF